MTELEKVIEAKKAFKKRVTKKAVKKGTLCINTVETTPFVFNDRLYYFGWNRKRTKYNDIELIGGNYRIVDFETNEVVSDFADNHCFGCIYTENNRFYAIGTRGQFGTGNTIDLFVSDDMKNWECHEIFKDPSWRIYNTSVCKGENGYIMAVEIDKPVEIAGTNPFTIVFMQSDDLYNWRLLEPKEHIYVKERYAACPVIRYVGGYYYMIYLEMLPGYNCVPYIARTKDLHKWGLAPLNPVMFYDDNDRIVIHKERFTEEELKLIKTAVNTNNSDVDLCEWQGKTYIFYSWGNQLGTEFLAYSEFDGTMLEYFESFF